MIVLRALSPRGPPDFPKSWRHQLPVLAEASYRAVAIEGAFDTSTRIIISSA